jgi:hypothetical protein
MNKNTRSPELSKPDLIEEKILRRVPLEILALSLIIGLAAALLKDIPTGIFILAGGAFSALSFLWLRQSFTRILSLDRKKAIRSGILFYALRFLLILAAFMIIISFLPQKLIAFVIGFSTIVLVTLAEAVIALSRMKQWKS